MKQVENTPAIVFKQSLNKHRLNKQGLAVPQQSVKLRNRICPAVKTQNAFFIQMAT